jgi:BirA family biotin operon repressor/biotin-[acetyl-CoA-carboxylase] ligase
MSETSGVGPAWRLEVFASLPSTSDVCIERARGGEPAELAILAREQTAGRGSRGRAWLSPPGNLYLSVLLRPRGAAAELGGWALLAGVALSEALARRLGDRSALRLKWPNDVLLRDRKVAGILLDSATARSGGIDWLVIGFGANLAVAPGVPGRATTSLAEAGANVDPTGLAHDVLDEVGRWQALAVRRGFAVVREAWIAIGHPLGSPLSIVAGGITHKGAFAGLDDTNALRLTAGGVTRTFSAGEILMPRPA